VQGLIAAEAETSIPLTLTPMTVGPMLDTVQIIVAGVDDVILVKHNFAVFNVVFLHLDPVELW